MFTNEVTNEPSAIKAAYMSHLSKVTDQYIRGGSNSRDTESNAATVLDQPDRSIELFPSTPRRAEAHSRITLTPPIPPLSSLAKHLDKLDSLPQFSLIEVLSDANRPATPDCPFNDGNFFDKLLAANGLGPTFSVE
jgi:hypothetical protein